MENRKPAVTGAAGSEGDEAPQQSGVHDDIAMMSSPEELEQGYRIMEQIGEGAASRVFKAVHQLLLEEVAIKVLKKDSLLNPDSIERFKKEARLAMRLNHANIIRLKSFGINSKNEPFIVMQYCQGESLESYLKKKAPLSSSACRFIGLQAAEALRYAHQEGIIHRDIKPANILLESAPQAEPPYTVKLLDFGIAKEIEQAGDAGGALTGSTHTPGTPAYMSPEQCRRQAVDLRSDIYSLGCLLYECATGRRPFEADSDLAVMNLHLNAEPSFKSSDLAGEDLRAVICKCLCKDPSRRYQNAEELIAALQAVSVRGRPRRSVAGFMSAFIIFGAVLTMPLYLLLFAGSHHGPAGWKQHLAGAGKEEALAALNASTRVKSHLKALAKARDFHEDAEEIMRNAIDLKKSGSDDRISRAEAMLKQARKLAQDHEEPVLAAKCLSELALLYRDSRRYEEAQSALKQCLAELENSQYKIGAANACRVLAGIYCIENNMPQAIFYKRKAVKLCPKTSYVRSEVKRELADSLVNAGYLQEAQSLLEQSKDDLSIYDGNEVDYKARQMIFINGELLKLAVVEQQRGEIHKRLEALIASTRKYADPGFSRLFLKLANVLKREKNPADAELAARQVLHLPPGLRSESELKDAEQLLKELSQEARKEK